MSVPYIPVLDAEYMQQTIVLPLNEYEKRHDAVSLDEIKDAIKIALMMVSGFRDILDDLNFNEEKLRALQFALDDNYDVVEKIFEKTSDASTRTMIDSLLTEMAKLDMEIGDLILEHRHAS